MTLRTVGRGDFGKSSQDGFTGGKKTVTTNGTAEQLPSNAVPSGFLVVVKALASNSTPVHIAKTKALAEVDATAYQLNAGETIGLKVKNTDAIWVDANTNGEGVTFIFEESS